MSSTIDLNSDLGESFGRWTLGDDAAMLPLVTSANIACGFHAGDPATLLSTCRDSVDHGVRIGAQVSYRDLAGFGRRFVDASRTELIADVIYQVGALQGIAAATGGRVTYVKPHGALYNTAVEHEVHADAVAEAVADVDDSLALLGLPGSALLRAGERRGLRTVPEAFADRAYTPAGQLVSRRKQGAVLTDPGTVADRVLRLVQDGVVTAADGTEIAVDAASICLHGDTEGAVALATAVRRRLDDAGITVRAFT